MSVGRTNVEGVMLTGAASVLDAVTKLLNKPATEKPVAALFLDLHVNRWSCEQALGWVLELRRVARSECERRQIPQLLLPPVVVFANELAKAEAKKLQELGAIVVDPSLEWYKDCIQPEDFLARIGQVEKDVNAALLESAKEFRPAPVSSPALLTAAEVEDLNSFPPGITQQDLVEYFRQLNI